MKRILSLILIAVLVLTVAACGRPVPEDPGNQDDNGNGVEEPGPVDETEEITLYYMNQEYLNTGNEELEKFIKVEREVTVGERPLEEIIIEELQKTPEDEELYTALENIKILSVEIIDNIANVNISSDGLQGGSLEESAILYQVVLSLTELTEVTAVQFLVDGSKQESLMGHFLIEEPITRDELSLNSI